MYVFPLFAGDGFTDEARIQRMLDVSKHWVELCDQDASFPDTVRGLKFVRLGGGQLTTIDQCVDPAEKLCRDLLPSKVPADVMKPLLHFMRFCLGFPKGLTPTLFLECASLAAETEDVKRAEVLVDLLLDPDRCREMIGCELDVTLIRKDRHLQSFFAKVSQLRFVPTVKCVEGILIECSSGGGLHTFAEVAMLQHIENRTFVADSLILYVPSPLSV